MGKQTTHLKLEDKTHQALKDISESTGITMNALMNIAILNLIKVWNGNDAINLEVSDVD